MFEDAWRFDWPGPKQPCPPVDTGVGGILAVQHWTWPAMPTCSVPRCRGEIGIQSHGFSPEDFDGVKMSEGVHRSGDSCVSVCVCRCRVCRAYAEVRRPVGHAGCGTPN